jgi:uncharacterized protein YqeY
MASETYDNIQATIKNAMKSGDTTTRDVLRMVVSDIKNKTVNEGKEITEEAVITCLKKFAKQIEDSIESAKMAARIDLEEKARGELAIVSQFLPSMIPNEQMTDIIANIVAENEKKLGRSLTKKDFGSLMKMLPSNCDKKYCSGILQGLLK